MSIQQSTRNAIADGVITAKVRAVLRQDPITAHHDICVETLAGIVALSGFVETDIVRIEAVQVTAHVRGVLHVKNLLDVRTFG
ncbi:BON domain-containing protein [Peristeroidobacter soli]|jgi:osmotically-inducible protein OsmY|uniref:BON domain-containing protein n=1 Tax=Peristeroidobacter soli TaxID=2497877 RepID=UPI00101BF5D6|nr:BON domain-containing protein [Peristeroidobacter soli]